MTAWPSALLPERMTIQLVSVSGGTAPSPYSGRQHFFRLPGGFWRAGFSWSSAREAQWRQIMGFVAGLGGRAGRFTLADPGYRIALGGFTSGTVTATGTALASTVALAGLAGTNPVLVIGDRLSIADRLYMVTADATHTAGAATVSIAPPLRASCSSAAVNLTAPVGTFSLADDQQGSVGIRPPWFGEVSIEMVEPL